MKKRPLLSAVAACVALLSGCRSGDDGSDALSRYEGKWTFSYEQNGKRLELPVNRRPMVELFSDGTTESHFRKDGKVITQKGTWTVVKDELILYSGDGKTSSRFRIVSDTEAREELPVTGHIRWNTVMILEKK